MSFGWNHITLGRTNFQVSRLGLGSSFGVGARDVERAFDRGINYLYWGTYRRASFGKGVREIARKNREKMVLVLQTYARSDLWVRPSLERALRQLKTEYTDLLLLGWWNRPPPPRVLDAALRLKEEGKARALLISCHHRPTFQTLAANPAYGGIMVRYNAAHPGAENEVFPHLSQPRPGVVAYTATRWGSLLNPQLTPPGEPTPRASDCYRFVLSNPNVDVCLTAPKDGTELDEALSTLDKGPMTADELAWMKRVGAAVHATPQATSRGTALKWLDRVDSWISGRPG